MATKKSVGSLTEADLKGKRVLLRANLDVPLDDDQKITDGTIIRGSVVPAIKYLTEKGAKVILASHPGGATPLYSSKPLAPRLSELLEVDVVTANDCIAEDLQQLVASLPDGGVLLLETASFYDEEEKNDAEFAKKLASIADILYHTSTDDGVSSELPVGTSRMTLPGAFAYEITGEDKKVIHHISGDGGRHASTKVQEGKGLSGVFDWSGEDGSAFSGESRVEDKYVEHI